jgi:hypothetical protein
VQDAALSGCGVEGEYLPMRIMKVGEWHLTALAGPCLTQLEVNPALEFLESLGVELSARGLKQSADKLGALWEFVLAAMAEPPRILNADGHELVPQTATFKVADLAALERALRARKSVLRNDDAHGGAGAWVWIRRGGPTPGFGGHTILGSLEMIDDRLVLEVDSAERLAQARKWIEKLPGVEFERATAHELSFEEEGPLDDALPEKPLQTSPETARAIEEEMGKILWTWLDMRIPALKGETPREASKTAEGRRRVGVLVRTMPDAIGPRGVVAAPREAMLKELDECALRRSGLPR